MGDWHGGLALRNSMDIQSSNAVDSLSTLLQSLSASFGAFHSLLFAVPELKE